jgi:hypothetical protein
MRKKYIIKNNFFDLIAFFTSFFFSFFKSFLLFFNILKNKKNNIFFNFLDFMFRLWPKYFWKKPSFYKISSFFSDMLNFIFKVK